MALTSYPFANQDTTENQYSLLFREFQNNGVVGNIDGPGFKVSTDGSGLDVEVAAGFAIVRGHAVDNSSSLTLGLAAPESQARLDLVVLRLDPSADSIVVAVKKGAAGSSSPPALTQTATGVYEIAVAEIVVAAGTVNISTSDITDRRTYSGSQVGVWRTETRPSDPRKYQLGYNVSLGAWEFRNGAAWTSLPYLLKTDKAADSNLLDGLDSSYFYSPANQPPPGAGPKVVTGTYTGSGASSRVIVVAGLTTVRLVLTLPVGSSFTEGTYVTGAGIERLSTSYTNTPGCSGAGFTLGGFADQSGTVYNYTAIGD